MKLNITKLSQSSITRFVQQSNKIKKCHIIDEYYPAGIGYIAPPFYTKRLAELGYHITVLCCRTDCEREYQLVNKAQVYRTPFIYRWGSRLHSIRLADYCIKKLIKLITFDIVHVCYFSASPLIHICLRVSEYKGKHICDIRSVPIEQEFWGKCLRILAAKVADGLIVLDKEIVKAVFGENKIRKYDEVPLGGDVGRFSKRPSKNRRDQMRKGLGFEDNDIICISIGTLDKTRKQDEMILGFAEASKKIHNLGLLVVGEGQELRGLKKLVKNIDVEKNVKFIRLIPHNAIHRYLHVADIGITYLPIRTYNAQPPTKTIEYLSAGLAIIATDTKGNRKFLNKHQAIKIIQDDLRQLAKAIIESTAPVRENDEKVATQYEHLLEFDCKTIV